MAKPAPNARDGWETTIPVPGTVRLPVELEPPEGFDPVRLETWPRIDGRLEWVAGRLCWMPPCGARQSMTVADVVGVLSRWAHTHPDFSYGTNEPGLRLGDDIRAADAAVWRRRDVDPRRPGLVSALPVLAVEVGGREESAVTLRAKAASYLAHGVAVVWLVLPDERRVVVVTRDGDSTIEPGATLPRHPALPDLAPAVDELLRQVRAAD